MRRILLAITLILSGCVAPVIAPQPGDARPIVFDVDLWQAARETVDFLPLEETDPIAGTIETGWGIPRGGYGERFKISVRLDYGRPYKTAVHVTVRHERQGDDGWEDGGGDTKAALGLEEDIARTAQELHGQELHGQELHSGQIAGKDSLWTQTSASPTQPPNPIVIISAP